MGAVAQGVAGRWPVFLERGCGPGVCKASLVSRVRDEVMACWAGGRSRDMGGQTQRVRVAGRPGWGSRCVWALVFSSVSGGHTALAEQGGSLACIHAPRPGPPEDVLRLCGERDALGPGVDPRTWPAAPHQFRGPGLLLPSRVVPANENLGLLTLEVGLCGPLCPAGSVPVGRRGRSGRGRGAGESSEPSQGPTLRPPETPQGPRGRWGTPVGGTDQPGWPS